MIDHVQILPVSEERAARAIPSLGQFSGAGAAYPPTRRVNRAKISLLTRPPCPIIAKGRPSTRSSKLHGSAHPVVTSPRTGEPLIGRIPGRDAPRSSAHFLYCTRTTVSPALQHPFLVLEYYVIDALRTRPLSPSPTAPASKPRSNPQSVQILVEA